MNKLTNAEPATEFKTTRKYPSGIVKDELIKIRMQVLEMLTYERSSVL
jgi:hypothetical protein